MYFCLYFNCRQNNSKCGIQDSWYRILNSNNFIDPNHWVKKMRHRVSWYDVLQRHYHRQDHKLWDDKWCCGFACEVVVRVCAIGAEQDKADICPCHVISHPLLKLRNSGIDFREFRCGTRYSKTGDTSLNPFSALLALQWSTRVALHRDQTEQNNTYWQFLTGKRLWAILSHFQPSLQLIILPDKLLSSLLLHKSSRWWCWLGRCSCRSTV